MFPLKNLACKGLRHVQLHMSKYKNRRFTLHYVKPTAQLLFKSRFPKSGPTYRRQVVNPWHQTPQGQSVAKPETSVFPICESSGRSSERRGGSSTAERCAAATPPPLPLVGVRGASPGKFLQKWKSNPTIWCILRDDFMFNHWFFTDIGEQVCFNFSPNLLAPNRN